MPNTLIGRLTGRTAVITGAARGIGAATALRLAGEGASVVLLDLRDAEPVAEKINAAGPRRALAIVGDVGAEETWSRVTEQCRAAFGPVDVLVSNAYLAVVQPTHETSLESWERQLRVNLTGAWLGLRACLSDLCRPGPSTGSVVFVSSVHALVGLPGRPAYAAAKAGLTGLARQVAAEYGHSGLRVNSVLPGPIQTAAWDDVPADAQAASAAQTVLGRLGRPEEVAAAIAFLASDDASYVTGASVVVDGGWSTYKTSA